MKEIAEGPLLVSKAGATARFGTIEMTMGFPAAMNIALLTRHLRRRVALEIAMTGQFYTAERYHALGWINRLAEPGLLSQSVDEFLALLNSLEPWAVARTKQAFRMAEQSTDPVAVHLADELDMLLIGERQSSVVKARTNTGPDEHAPSND